jgi:uncharacterized membrane protein HdeD (DUF308 family)
MSTNRAALAYVPLEPQRASVPMIARGLVSFGYAGLALARTQSLHAVASLFATWALVDAVLVAVAAVMAQGRTTRWWPLLLQAVAGIAVAVELMLNPPISALGLKLVVALWAIATGVFEIAGGMMLQRGSWALGLTGVVSVFLGLLLTLWPGGKLLPLVALTTSYAALSGALEVWMGVAVRPRERRALIA